MTKSSMILVFVHGWSVTNTDTYGGLPARLRNDAKARGLNVEIKHVFLGRYISFHDEVRLPDVGRAFNKAVDDELGSLLEGGKRFVCITHSTGGPVVRDWWHRHYDGVQGSGVCPMSHLVMLAPANFGSALAQLGKGRIGRLKSWFGGVEPGQGVLDWLELGSAESWELNTSWIESGDSKIAANGILPFVLTGQTIDRKLYDHLNTYTGESGSDGVVRVAAANLEGRMIELKQEAPRKKTGKKGGLEAPNLTVARVVSGPQTALKVIRGASHSGSRKGIMRSVRVKAGHARGRQVVDAIFECMAVSNRSEYRQLVEKYQSETDQTQTDERLEIEEVLLLADKRFVHDRHSMVVFRVHDDEGYPVSDFDLILTGGNDNDPDKLPAGFFVDRQRNNIARNIVTYFFNYDIMVGAPLVKDKDKVIRPATESVEALGVKVIPRPSKGFVHYLNCDVQASKELLHHVLQPNSTTLVDICLRRVVRKNVFRMKRMKGDSSEGGFKKTPPGDDFVS